jgi:hypothetical protein
LGGSRSEASTDKKLRKTLLWELVRMQRGGLQNGGGLCLVLEHRLHGNATYKHFRTHRCRYPESLLAKKDRSGVHSPDM